ncbi:MAG: hypothetical protein DCE90_18015 [Pseudanabaena sp.]|nr:MAG: hypothetical protein DCE90_18015 [Pseudanabaena sp.]
MAVKKTIEVVPQLPEAARSAEDLLSDRIADQILDEVNWQKVLSAIVRKAPSKLLAWLTKGEDTPINISQFPELAALPSRDDEGKAA